MILVANIDKFAPDKGRRLTAVARQSVERNNLAPTASTVATGLKPGAPTSVLAARAELSQLEPVCSKH